MSDLLFSERIESAAVDAVASRSSLAARCVGRCDGCARSVLTARLAVAVEPAPRDGRYCPVCRLLLEQRDTWEATHKQYELR